MSKALEVLKKHPEIDQGIKGLFVTAVDRVEMKAGKAYPPAVELLGHTLYRAMLTQECWHMVVGQDESIDPARIVAIANGLNTLMVHHCVDFLPDRV